jgi:thiol-disulfide isomerase/thioredoxin
MMAINNDIKLIKSTIYLLIILFADFSTSFAQNIYQVKLNDKLPNCNIENIIQNPAYFSNTDEMSKDGLLIVNFWATWCVPCVKELKILAEQVERHKGKLHVICVGYENKKVIEEFLKHQPEIKNSGLTIISDDKLFVKLFIHQALPYNVWINNDKMVKAITTGEEINQQNIDKFLANSSNNMHVLKDLPFDQFKPIHIPDSLIEFRSIFHAKHLEGVAVSGSTISQSGLGRDNMKNFRAFNLRINTLFWNAYRMPGGVDNLDYMEVITKDSTKFFWPGKYANPQKYRGPTYGEWSREHDQTYELMSAKVIPDSLFFRHVISDLELNLNVKTTIDLRKRSCWLVRYPKPSDHIKFIQNDSIPYVQIANQQLIISHVPVDYLLRWIYNKTQIGNGRKQPYINLTEIKNPISAIVNLGDDASKYKDRVFIEECLTRQLGFTFNMEEYKYPILVIKDN